MEIFGLKFPNPVGLAAGMDKLAQAVPVWPALGFGFSELGGVTWHPQPGNPAPRLFRAIPDEAHCQQHGLQQPRRRGPGRGPGPMETGRRWPAHPVGVNLGKSKITPLGAPPEDYANSFRVLRPHADFLSSTSVPPTPPTSANFRTKPPWMKSWPPSRKSREARRKAELEEEGMGGWKSEVQK